MDLDLHTHTHETVVHRMFAFTPTVLSVSLQPQVEVRPMMYVALTYDHRLIDGREAVLFLKKIKQAVEDPRVLLLGL